MLSWFQMLMPRDQGFFELFERHAQTIVAVSRALRALLDGGDGVESAAREIKRQENEADVITRELRLAERRTFTTPFGRGDIRELITATDDTIDQMRQTAKATLICETREFQPATTRRIIVQAADTGTEVPLLRDMRRNARRLNSCAEEITRIQDEADSIYDHGLRELFRARRDSNPLAFIMGSEVYGHLGKALDGSEDTAVRISGVVIGHV